MILGHFLVLSPGHRGRVIVSEMECLFNSSHQMGFYMLHKHETASGAHFPALGQAQCEHACQIKLPCALWPDVMSTSEQIVWGLDSPLFVLKQHADTFSMMHPSNCLQTRLLSSNVDVWHAHTSAKTVPTSKTSSLGHFA